MRIICVIVLIWNILICGLYGLDKLFAKKRHRRISEKTLLLLPLFMGAPGAMFGMILFNHKTSKPKFRVWIPAEVILNIILIFVLDFLLKKYIL